MPPDGHRAAIIIIVIAVPFGGHGARRRRGRRRVHDCVIRTGPNASMLDAR
jgi:hypothetical protein